MFWGKSQRGSGKKMREPQGEISDERKNKTIHKVIVLK